MKPVTWIIFKLLIVFGCLSMCFLVLVTKKSTNTYSINVRGSDLPGDTVDDARVGGTREVSMVVSKLTKTVSLCNINLTPEMDIIKRPPLKFVSVYKNPCWYIGEDLHCIPYMYLVGMAKCGTTDLFKRIALHPDFVAPTRKEPNWLSRDRFIAKQSLQFYASKYFSPLAESLNNADNSRCDSLITGEGSISTMDESSFWHMFGPNIGHSEPVQHNQHLLHHLFMDARILINVRNPIDRLWSEYLAFSRAREKTAERFHSVVVKQQHIYNECLQIRSLRSCLYDRALARLVTMNKSELERLNLCSDIPVDILKVMRGVYHVYIKDYLGVFPRNQIRIQRLEDISKRPMESLLETFVFLDMRTPNRKTINRIEKLNIRNTRSKSDKKTGEMWQKTRILLYEFYKPHNEALAKLLNDSDYLYDE